MKIRSLIILFFLFGWATGMVSCAISQVQFPSDPTIADSEEDSRTREEDSLVIWWRQSSVGPSNKEIARLVQEWEQSSGIKTTLRLKSISLKEEFVGAIEQGNAPDIAFIPGISHIPTQLAWEGKLADVSDVIEPIRDSFNQDVLDGIYYLNRTINKSSFYAIPIGMPTEHIHYWKPYLDRLGLKASDIPQDWQGFWQFWQEVRDQLHQLGEKDINSFCITLSKNSDDGSMTFLSFLHGHNADIFDNEGRFVLDRPENRQGLINTLSQLSSLYQEGYIPSGAMDWTDSGNNIQFLDRQCLLTSNMSLSIPTTQKKPDNLYNQKVRNRYFEEIVTVSRWPNTVNGSPFKASFAVIRLVVPADTNHLETAKEFLTYLLQPEHIQRLIEQEKGRFLPPMPELLNTPFWQNDPHFSAVRSLSRQNIRPFPILTNPAFGEIKKEKIFTSALERVIREGISPEEAADDIIARIQEIINQHYQ